MTIPTIALDEINLISSYLDMLSEKWDIDPIVRDLHLGKRTDLQDYAIKINQVTFHIPYIIDLSLFFYGDVCGRIVIIVVIVRVVYL